LDIQGGLAGGDGLCTDIRARMREAWMLGILVYSPMGFMARNVALY